VDLVDELFRHNSWANRRLLEFCAGLEPPILDSSAPGTMGSIIDTLRHLSGAEERYLEFLELASSRRDEVMEGAKLDLPALQREAAGRTERWDRLLARKLDPGEVIERTRKDGTVDALPRATLLLQAIHHGNDHRTHICTILGAQGIEPPELDGWNFYSVE